MIRAVLIMTELGAALSASERPEAVQNVIVHKEAGRFGGWPANNGIWSWGNEIVVGFKLGYFKPNDHGHAIRRPHLEDGDALIQRRRRRRKDRVPRMPRRPGLHQSELGRGDPHGFEQRRRLFTLLLLEGSREDLAGVRLT